MAEAKLDVGVPADPVGRPKVDLDATTIPDPAHDESLPRAQGGAEALGASDRPGLTTAPDDEPAAAPGRAQDDESRGSPSPFAEPPAATARAAEESRSGRIEASLANSPDTLYSPWTPTPGPAVDPSFVTPARYAPVGLLGRGGMGEVWEVADTHLRRNVAFKVCLRDSVAAIVRFSREARITARLQHPGVLALYDLGRMDDGRPWYTMRLVPAGRTLRVGWAATPDPRARVRPLLGVASVLAFAHRLGIRHLDVKPENVLLGAFGEVLLLDWGVAQDGEPEPGVAGTPIYAAPEQRTAPLPPADVYAFGVLLHEAVVGHPYLARGGDGPAELRDLWTRCTAPEPEARPSAQEAAERLAAWLDDVARRQRAEAHLARADELAPRGDRLREEAAELTGAARGALDALPRLAPVESKTEAWDAEERAARLLQEATVADAEWEGAVTAALAEADLPEARDRLAERFLARLLDNPGASEAPRWERGVRTYGGPSHLARLDAPGRVTLITDPPCRVRAFRYVAERRRLVPVFAWESRTPLVEARIEPGSWLFELEAPGFESALYPVSVARGEHWDGVPPGGTGPETIPLFREGALGPDDVYVPAGWAHLGGDPLATDSLPAGRRWVDGFVIRRFPVTVGEYLDWLHGLVDAGDEEAVARCQPRERFGPANTMRPLWARDGTGRFLLGPDATGNHWRHAQPVTYLDWLAARTYAQASGWRLPAGVELEKAARGVDGRTWPWGERFEPTWACTIEGHSGPAALADVSSWSRDESPFGVRGMAGNARSWCAHTWARPGAAESALIEIRGGAFTAAPNLCRPAGRFAAAPERTLSSLGLRLCRDVQAFER